MEKIFSKKGMRRLSPSTTIALSFLMIIILGTVLFTLPFMTRDGKGLSFFTALFTATSSVCVTGLTLIDPAVTLTRYGQILLALLIEIGGISMVSFASFFMFSLKKKTTLRSMRLAQEYTNLDVFSETKSLTKVIIATAFSCQAMGALILCFRFVPKLGAKGIWTAVFMAISAYCNAGFDLMGIEQEFGSLINYNGDILVMFTVIALIISGGLGFFVFYDLLHYKKNRRLTLHTKVVSVFTLTLVLFGFLLFFVSEYGNEKTIGNLPLGQKLMASFFQSVSARTAGFASVDAASMNGATKLLMMFFMFIGAGSGSTAGGIKITTFAVIFMFLVSVVRDRDDTIIMRHRVDRKVVGKSLAIAIMGLFVVFITASLLYIDNPHLNGIDVIYEAVSAFATVGVSVGVTGSAGVLGLLSLILTMFIGRLGPVCFIVAFGVKNDSNVDIVRPEGRIMVG